MSQTTTAPELATTTTTAPPADPATAEPAAPPSIITAPAEPAAPAAPPAPVVPEKYAFEPPVIDGKPVEVDPAALGSFEETARAAGLTQAQFEAVAGLGLKVIGEKLSAAVASAMPEHLREATQSAWMAESTAALGDKPGETLALAAKALDEFGGKELRQALDVTRAGNHPAVVKALVEIGRRMGEAGKLLTGSPATGGAGKTQEQAARAFYNAAGGNYPEVEA